MGACCARLALVLHLSRWATEQKAPVLIQQIPPVNETSMISAIQLIEWFKQEARRVHASLEESVETKEQRELLDLILEKGGSLSVRELKRARSRYRQSAEAAQAALQSLAEAGYGHWITESRGGRPTKRLVLQQEG